MKKLIFHAAVFLGLISSMWGQSLPEMREILRKDEGYDVIAKLMKESSEVRRKELLRMIVDLVKAHLAEPATSKNNKIRFDNAARLLMGAGDENAILDALKDGIDNAGFDNLIEAVEVLASCRGEEQTDIIERLARDRLGILGDTLVVSQDEEERRARNHLLGSFARILMGLASSANPSGMARAKKIRDEFAVLYPSENGKLFVTKIDEEFAKITPRQPAPIDGPDTGRESRPPGGISSPVSNAPEAGPGTSIEKPRPATTWSVAATLTVAGIGLLWFLLKRRS